MSPRLTLLTRAALALLLAGGTAPAHGDEVTRRVQEELRRRQIYFGEIDGLLSQEVAKALRRFQKRKGHPATGTIDDATRASLGIAPERPEPAEKEPSLPDVPVLKSDAARALSEADRGFLEKLEGSEPPPIAEPPEEDFAIPPAPPRPAEPPAPTAGRAAADAPDEQGAALAFIRAYLAAAARDDIKAEMAFYGDRIAYFDHGVVGRAFIEKDVRNYRARWPQRKYEPLAMHAAPGEAPGEVEVRFTLRYEVQGARLVPGRTKNVFRVRRTDEGLKLIAMRERRARP